MKLQFLGLILFPIISFGQLTIAVTSIPDDTPAEDDIYVAGSFNAWNPGNTDYILMSVSEDTLMLTFEPDAGTVEFKFTRGDWATVEGNEFGGYLPNRVHVYSSGPDTIWCTILTWEDTGGPVSTAAWNVEILDETFYIPQLDTERRIWIYLPPDYYSSANVYKVLYMHDGQNVFDLSTSFAGEWEVDETLNVLFDEGDEGCIVVAVDNGGIDRLEEYSPWAIPGYGVSGRGELYIEFLAETLKPYIDEHFRTRPEPEWTGLMGSSMGGLISQYGGIARPDVFGKLGVFSPSYWVSDSCYWFTESTDHDLPLSIYTIAGALEGSSMTDGVDAMETIYEDAGFGDEEHIATIHADGQHSEWYWAREFEDAYHWLWKEETVVGDITQEAIHVWPNPAVDILHIDVPDVIQVYSMTMTDLRGEVIWSANEFNHSISRTGLNGLFHLLLKTNAGNFSIPVIWIWN